MVLWKSLGQEDKRFWCVSSFTFSLYAGKVEDKKKRKQKDTKHKNEKKLKTGSAFGKCL